MVPDSVEQLMAHSNLEGTINVKLFTPVSAYTHTLHKTCPKLKKSSAFTVSTGGTLETLFLFRPLAGVEEEISSRSPPPLTLLEGEVALLLLELADIAGWFHRLAR